MTETSAAGAPKISLEIGVFYTLEEEFELLIYFNP